MRCYKVLRNFASCSFVSRCHSVSIKNGSANLRYFKSFNTNKYRCTSLTRYSSIIKLIHTEGGEKGDRQILEGFDSSEIDQLDDHNYVRNILKDSTDPIQHDINKCVTLEELFDTVNKHFLKFDGEHAALTLAVLCDMQMICNELNAIHATTNVFLENLFYRDEFNKLLNLVDVNVHRWNVDHLAYILMNLYKLGIPPESEFLQKLAIVIRDHLEQNFSVQLCSLLLTVIVAEQSVRPFYLAANLIPRVFSVIDSCNDMEELKYLSMCLYKLRTIITEDVVQKYVHKIEQLIYSRTLTDENYKSVIKVIIFLNYSQWRNLTASLTSKCILLLKNVINILSLKDLSILYEAFFVNQEPASILSDIQQSASKYIRSEVVTPRQASDRLNLFSSVMYFSSPIHRIQYSTLAERYIKDCSLPRDYYMFRKILSYLKISDPKICNQFWTSGLKLFEEKPFEAILKLGQSYVSYIINMAHYRNKTFEDKMATIIEGRLKNDFYWYFPIILSSALCFTMIYGQNKELINRLITKLEENAVQLKYMQCLRLSESLKVLHLIGNRNLNNEYVTRINKVIDQVLQNQINSDINISKAHALIKTYTIRKMFKGGLAEVVLSRYKELNCCSKVIETITNCSLLTSNLIPEIIDKFAEYIVQNKDSVAAFNAERILYLCYQQGYYPINGEKFFEVMIDIIMRDQERLGGLAIVQGALSLCFFNKLPVSFIKQIFSVEFLDRLDCETEKCYSKDFYPKKLRTTMMSLNRAVCLDCPDCNVPWFHKNFKIDPDDRVNAAFSTNVRECLYRMVGYELISEHITTPYGYNINFVLHLDINGEVVKSNSRDVYTKLAILLLPSDAYTKVHVNLKGYYQLKKRHLEILGYRVVLVQQSNHLVFAEDKFEYLSNLLFPKNTENSSQLVKR